MNNVRKYGQPPCTVALVHGGPGAPGEMAPVARELSAAWGILEPLQTRDTLQGQVEELEAVLVEHGLPPLTLIGYSWGAMLSLMVAARNPSLVGKLILVSSAVFEEKYAAGIMEIRLSRLSSEERMTVDRLTGELDDPAGRDKDRVFARLGALIARADSCDPVADPDDGVIEYQYHIYEGVWREAVRLRSSGALLAMAQAVRCPVLAIHGDHDPHPAEGVRVPLSGVLRDFRFLLLERCGHCPWREKHAGDSFYATLRSELQP